MQPPRVPWTCLYSPSHRYGSVTHVTMTHYRRGKRKHLSPSDCWSLSNSSEGAFSLTQPFTYTGTNGGLNRGLYPRDRKDRRTAPRLYPLQRQWAHNAKRPSEDATTGKAIVGPTSSKVDSVFDPEDFLSNDLFAESNVLALNSKSSGEHSALLLRSPNKAGDAAWDGCTKRPSFEDAPTTQQRNWVEGDELEFVPYKKLYYRYRKGEESAVKEIDLILKENNIKKEDELCVLNLIKYIASFQNGLSVNSEAVLSCLKDHPLFKQAEESVAQTLSNLAKAAGTAHVWAVLAVIVLLSASVKDIQGVISCLQQPHSTLPRAEVTEILYCMATLLFAFRERGINISSRIHYNLFCTLYLMENPTCTNRKHMKHLHSAQESGRLEIHNIKLTPEQQQILNQETAPGHVIKIVGFAGAGKTSMLIEYARSRPHLRFLYIVSTKSVPVEISRVFPSNVECTTVHALAYRYIGHKYQRKKKLMAYDLKPFVIFGLPEARGSFFRANLICQSLCTFFSSMDEAITISHVPERCKSTCGGIRPMEYQENLELVEDAKRIWRKMMDLGETKENGYFMTHDGYLKLWQLSKPSLSQFDIILLDEAEDCSPAIMDIVLSQKCGKILVADPHQQTSGFKDTVDALLKAHRPHLFSLTQSFRFGPKIAYVAATILDVCKQVKDKTLVGGSQDGNADHNTGQTAVLCGTNAAVFDEAVSIVTSENPSKIYIIGGLDKFGMDTILDIWMLMAQEKERATKDLVIRDPFIRIFEHKGGLCGLKDYAAEAEDKELEERIAVVEKYSLGLPVLIEKITSYSVTDSAFANIVLGTVHKAKGYEFDTVQITNDLVKVPGYRHDHMLSEFRIDVVPEIDWNLLYIAVTRAKRCLVMNRPLECLLSFAGNGGEDDTGPLCCECAKQRIGPLTYLLASPELVKSVG